MSIKKIAVCVFGVGLGSIAFTYCLKPRIHVGFGVGLGGGYYHRPWPYHDPFWGPPYYPYGGVSIHTNDPGAAVALGAMGAAASIAAASSYDRYDPERDLQRHNAEMRSQKVREIKTVDREIERIYSRIDRKERDLKKLNLKLNNKNISSIKKKSLLEKIDDLRLDVDQFNSKISKLKKKKKGLKEAMNDEHQ